MLRQYFQDPLDCSFMFLFHLHKDQNVIQVHHYDPFGYESSEDVVHHCLEGGCEGDQSRALQEIPQFELCYRMGYNSPPGDSSEN